VSCFVYHFKSQQSVLLKVKVALSRELASPQEQSHKLKCYRASRKEVDRQIYVTARKQYRHLLKSKRQTFRKQKTEALAKEINNGSHFWNELRKMGCTNKKKVVNNISTDEWFRHFKTVFQGNNEELERDGGIELEPSEDIDNILNTEILEVEVAQAIGKLKKGKASGIDYILAEMLQTGGSNIVMFLTKLFNVIFERGIYPEEWSKAIIIPLHKKGNLNDVDNYRGISLLSIISTCYTSILNTRLYTWLESNNLISECQAGFRRKYSTVDQIFTLYAVIQSQINKKGRKLYVAFVDFRKAFDSVQHNKLMQCIQDQGVQGKFFAALQAMYRSLKSCVRANFELTEMFDCPIGVRQGCVLSPTLFSLFVNQLADQINERGKHGVQLFPDIMELFILLFADDVALISTTPSGLQNQLNVVKTCCNKIKLDVNIDKTKVMVFRKGGFLGKHEKWFYDGKCLEVVNNYCYLGFRFTTMISAKNGTQHLVTKGKKAVVQLNRVFRKYKEMTVNTFFNIFDKKIQPILLYAAEVWGINQLEHIEKVHMMACKRFLGVPTKTPNKMIYGDLYRYPLYVNSYTACIRYWFKLLQMNNERLPYKAYQMLLQLDNSGKQCWVSKIREILCLTGFNIVWLQQGVGDVKKFLSIFKQRLIDMFIQEWSGTVRDRDRYQPYRSFKTIFVKESYVLDMENYCFRVAITQLRFNVFPLNNNVHRYSESIHDKFCPFCKNQIENEKHFVLFCATFEDLRVKFLKESKELPLHMLLRATDPIHRYNLSRYVFHASNRRKKIL